MARSPSSQVTDLDVRALTALLSLNDVDDDEVEASRRRKGGQDLTPASLTDITKVSSSRSGTDNANSAGCRESTKTKSVSGNKSLESLLGDVWEVEEVKLGQCVEPADPRPQPEYEVNYRQRVTANQVYLPLSSLASNGRGEEDLVVRVVLPGDLFTEVNLEVTSSTLRLASPNHLLHLPLPRQVDQRNGVATWDPNAHTLVVTLPISAHAQPLLRPASSSR
ncbi:dynein axonemal assembly factor 6-like [Penaeus chinensis]|uniref:dynein axonemal assembly factor 6-like n=1 Tax=Penaeus chinensis TaxID=139456 RepID=UPI001FB7EC59|nr:dynein axonemal assembly factor 6-like [Penaeus chinensis]